MKAGSNDESLDGLTSPIDLGDFKASWAGEYPPGRGLAFGADDGRVLLYAKKKRTPVSAETDEAINGLAFSAKWMGISTRDEVRFIDLSRGEFVRVPFGAHGVTGAPDGQFLAPLGTTGILFFRPGGSDRLPYQILRPKKGAPEIYFYRLICLKGPQGRQVIAAAARRSGIAAMILDAPQPGLHALTFEALDAIDLCPIADDSLAVAALGKDGTIILCRDVMEEMGKKALPFTVRLGEIRGTAYRILCADGVLIVATSIGIYFVAGLAANFVKRKIEGVTIRELPIKAIDVNVVGGHQLLIVTSRGVLEMDLRNVKSGGPGEYGHVHRLQNVRSLSPSWQERELEQLVPRRRKFSQQYHPTGSA